MSEKSFLSILLSNPKQDLRAQARKKVGLGLQDPFIYSVAIVKGTDFTPFLEF